MSRHAKKTSEDGQSHTKESGGIGQLEQDQDHPVVVGKATSTRQAKRIPDLSLQSLLYLLIRKGTKAVAARLGM